MNTCEINNAEKDQRRKDEDTIQKDKFCVKKG